MKNILNISRCIFLVVVFVFLTGSIKAESLVAFEKNASVGLKGSVEASPEYILGPGDVIEVYDYVTTEEGSYPKMIQQLPVLPDGTTTIVPVGVITVAGKSLRELNEEVQNELRKTIKTPRIFISVLKTRPVDFYILGAVMRPGHYSSSMPGFVYGETGRSGSMPDKHTMTVTFALEQAGGLKNTANVKNIILFRESTKEQISIDLWKLMYNGDTGQDVIVQPGDVIQVPEVNQQDILTPAEQKEIARSSIAPSFINVQVVGAVNTPGLYKLPPDSDMVTAIASAGGTAKNASRRVLVARINPDGSIKKIPVNLKDVLTSATDEEERIKLHPQDLIYVKYSPIKKFADFATDTIKNVSRSLTLAVLFDLINN
jgi:protein involved in polysaccharide export with SLBB domain